MGPRLGNRYDPEKDLQSLDGKVIFITGGTSGLGRASVKALAKRNPAHIYFTGRNKDQAQSLIAEVKITAPTTQVTFLKCDFQDLSTIRPSLKAFTHSSLDILICNAGIMALPPALSKDGYELQFAVNHLAHALIIKILLPALLQAASQPNADVRLIMLTTVGFQLHPKGGIQFSDLKTVQDFGFGGPWIRYGQSKFANVVYARHLSRKYPSITTAIVHPGVIMATDLVANTRFRDRFLIQITTIGNKLTLDEGVLNQLWFAAGAKKKDITSGNFYEPVGIDSTHTVTKDPLSDSLGKELWGWTEKALKDF